MKQSLFALGCLAIFCCSDVAFVSASPSNGISLPFQKKRMPKKHGSKLGKRQLDVVDAPLYWSSDYGTVVNMTVGSPPQPQSFFVSTSMGDSWLIAAQSQDCVAAPENCTHGTYASNASSTFSNLTQTINYPAFDLSWYFNATANGDYMSDSLTFKNITLDNMTFGLLRNTDFNWETGPNLGIGPPNTEDYAYIESGPYAGFLQQLKSGGYIDTQSFSIWFDGNSSGTLLIGGIDSAQYTDEMQIFPMVLDPQNKVLDRSAILLYSMRSYVDGNSVAVSQAEFGVSAGISTDYYYTYLPGPWVAEIYNAYNVTRNETWGPIVDCSVVNGSGTYLYADFMGLDTYSSNTGFSVPLSGLIEPVKLDNGSSIYFANGSQICYFAIDQSYDDYHIDLGDMFLRYFYVAVDYDAQQIGLARHVFNSDHEQAVVSDVLTTTTTATTSFGSTTSSAAKHSITSSRQAQTTVAQPATSASQSQAAGPTTTNAANARSPPGSMAQLNLGGAAVVALLAVL